ncbi:DUF411 domain-containing protein [Methylomarinum vadi]|uniref:DUF411 domain-containing protein n=1 Tax=Methylomarinum vadi TaxID=438855 RepID=UPI0004DF4F11|nr:DUF411 domain-containing protein [Methylomarinum vadi]
MNIIKLSMALMLLFFFLPINAETGKQNNEVLKIVVYRSPTCSCCGRWVQHLRDNHFEIEDIVSDDMQAIKEKYGVPRAMQSCHTAVIDGYVIEGHVPASDIVRLLQLKPKVVGISVPGMPIGTPGMEMGGRQDPYQVIAFDKKGNYRVFSDHGE